ncbi:family 10 glycosylhydrolase [Erwinia tracheiphila]|uniref:family 10 glycosylhydrolase n=1 Tax=Erwinia tracheiphila TaxID=65700 RepID=UPI002D7E677E|nr:family 10 glycosylhydrolase [Erwinia tracheiphila]
MQNRKMRAMWVASVFNLDWPSSSTLAITDDDERVKKQKDELTRILDDLAAVNMNTVIFQVVPCADALYSSKLLPWSKYLTGSLGKNPGFDPLEWAVEQAHARNIELHAWINPYRISTNTSAATVDELNNSSHDSPQSIFKTHPEWTGVAYNRYVLDPGIPEVQAWVTGIVEEIVSRYDVDGIQFDDYFYYESADSPLNDDATWHKFGQCFYSKGDWRRNNTYSLVDACHRRIKFIRPTVRFGISPAGVWRNKADDPLGSDTQAGAPNYDSAYADTRKWVLDGIIDYIVPQVYWPFARQVARYDVITRWWADTVRGTKTELYIGMALYKVGIPSSIEPDWTIEGGVPEITRQLNLNDSLTDVSGCMLFRHLFLNEPQTQRVIKYLKKRWAPAPVRNMYPIDYNSYRSVKGFNRRVRFLVMHYTAVDFATSIRMLAGDGVASAHYLVPDTDDQTYIAAGFNDMRVFNLVDENERAWHAGGSSWAGRSNLNDTSIGIEVVNLASDNNGVFIFPPYSQAQIDVIKELTFNIIQRYPNITPVNVVGHSDIAPGRKNDPGPAFPWKTLYEAGIGAWFDEETKDRYIRQFCHALPSKDEITTMLNRYGYDTSGSENHFNYAQLIRAFQLHFRPCNYSGKLDAETAAILYSLVEKYT